MNENEKKVCVLCNKEFTEYGNNPEPLKPYESGLCCDKCNLEKVIPARIEQQKKESK
jgi:hypothetical protein